MTKLYCPNGHKITKHYFQPIEIISPARPFARWHVSYCELCIRPYFDRDCLTEEQECEHATYTELKEEDGFVKGKCLCGRWKSIAPSSLIDIGKSQSQIAIDKVIEALDFMGKYLENFIDISQREAIHIVREGLSHATQKLKELNK